MAKASEVLQMPNISIWHSFFNLALKKFTASTLVNSTNNAPIICLHQIESIGILPLSLGIGST
ncbi:MAG: hypothetical protein QNJ54_13835 [Prochloraceae cyanobacterium]|nr:hypothetical protein [Prochloraceae cyanobacterium]